LVLFARRESELLKVKELAEEANKEGGTGAGGKVLVVVADMSKRESIDAVSTFSMISESCSGRER